MKLMKWMLLSCAFLFLVSPAFADVAPPPDYVEQCTVAKQQQEGMTCKSCSADRTDTDKCKKEWEPKGYKKACKTWGASAWTEIWCNGTPKEPANEPNTPADKDANKPDTASKDTGSTADTGSNKGGGCSVAGKGRFNPLGLFALAFLIGFGLIRRWREKA